MPTRLFILCLCLAAALVRADEAADRADLQTIFTQVRAALEAKDVETASHHLAEPFLLVPVGQQPIESRAALQDFVVAAFEGPTSMANLTIRVEPEMTVAFTSADSATSHGLATLSYRMQQGESYTLQARWTAALVRQDGAWKVGALHLGVDPRENELLATAQKGTGAAMGFLLLLGIGLGAVAATFLRKRQAPPETPPPASANAA
jgi:uncharacterized protein (TIGR02246 family)